MIHRILEMPVRAGGRNTSGHLRRCSKEVMLKLSIRVNRCLVGLMGEGSAFHAKERSTCKMNKRESRVDGWEKVRGSTRQSQGGWQRPHHRRPFVTCKGFGASSCRQWHAVEGFLTRE